MQRSVDEAKVPRSVADVVVQREEEAQEEEDQTVQTFVQREGEDMEEDLQD